MTENQKFKSKEIAFLLDNFTFKTVSEKLFKKNLFPDFIRNSYPKYSYIYKQNQEIDYIYFIREGEVELSMELNLIQLNDLIVFLVSKVGGDAKQFNVIQGKNKTYLRCRNKDK